MRQIRVMLASVMVAGALWGGVDGASGQTRTAPSITGAVRRVPPRPPERQPVTVRGANLPAERACRDADRRDDRYDRYDRNGRRGRDDRSRDQDRRDGSGRHDGRSDDRYDRNTNNGTGRLDTGGTSRGSITNGRVSQHSDGNRNDGCGYYDGRARDRR